MAVSLARPNKYLAKCFVCDRRVLPSLGFLIARSELADPKLPDQEYLTLCNSRPCVSSVAGESAVDDLSRHGILADRTIMMPDEPELVPFKRAMGACGGDQIWRLSPHRRDRERALSIADKLGLHYPPELAEFEDPAPVREAVARARAIPTIREYQVEGVRWIAYRAIDDSQPGAGYSFDPKDRKRGGLLCDDPGLGKTLQTLLALHDDEALVVVGPLSALAVWVREAKKWRADRFDKITVLKGEESFRWPENPRELVILNYDILPFTPAQIENEIAHALAKLNGHLGDANAKVKWRRSDIESLTEERDDLQAGVDALHERGAHTTTGGRHAIYLASVPLAEVSDRIARVETALTRARTRKSAPAPSCPVQLVGDELHYVESAKALRTQRWRYLAARARRVLGLTGTPAEKDPKKLRGLLVSACANPFTWFEFLRQFNGYKGPWNGYMFARHPGPVGTKALGSVRVEPGTTEAIGRYMLRRTKAQVLPELPAKVYSEIPVEVSPKLKKELDELAAVHVGELLAGAIPPFAVLSSTLKALSKGCIPVLLDLVESYELQDIPLVVFAANRSPVEALMKRAGWFGILGGDSTVDPGEVEDAFQSGEGCGVAGTQAMAEALTLTRASTVIQVLPFMSRKKNEQAHDRLHRIGQRDTVNIVMLVPDHVLVHHILALLVAKDQFVRDVLEGESTPQIEQASRITDESEDQWRARVQAKQLADAARAEREARLALKRRERELAAIASRDVTPKISEKRAKLRAERLAAERGESASSLHHGAPKAVTQAAFADMLSRCDGAITKDDAGFNAPDSAVARWLAPGVRKGSKYALASAAAILRHYPRQLSERFGELFE